MQPSRGPLWGPNFYRPTLPPGTSFPRAHLSPQPPSALISRPAQPPPVSHLPEPSFAPLGTSYARCLLPTCGPSASSTAPPRPSAAPLSRDESPGPDSHPPGCWCLLFPWDLSPIPGLATLLRGEEEEGWALLTPSRSLHHPPTRFLTLSQARRK